MRRLVLVVTVVSSLAVQSVEAKSLSPERMLRTVRVLSHETFEGRGFGSRGLEEAARLLVRRFRCVGLTPCGDEEGSFLQAFSARGGEPEREARLVNVVGCVPGDDRSSAGGSVVVGAHYDHLGYGWPDGVAGKVHPGADDNASGVAVLLEVARSFASGPPPHRTVIFCAFSGEEMGRLGSQHYVRAQKRFPVEQCVAMVNLDTVGRLGGGKLLVLGTGTAREWAHLVRGASHVAGAAVEAVAHDIGSSDQTSFLQAGVPAVQLFTGPHLDYHRPGDTLDKIDAEGLGRVAAVTREMVAYLASQAGKLTRSKSHGHGHGAGGPPKGTRKVSLGTVPDFAYAGVGVRVSDVVPESPAQVAGVRPGDVIIEVGEAKVESLRSLGAVLKACQPGQEVDVHLLRNGKELTVSARLSRR